MKRDIIIMIHFYRLIEMKFFFFFYIDKKKWYQSLETVWETSPWSEMRNDNVINAFN